METVVRSREKRVPDDFGPSQREVAADFDRVAESYELEVDRALAFSGMEHRFFIDVKRARLVEFVRDHFACQTSELDVLDLGCGIGTYHPGLQGVFHELHGNDVSADSIEIARARSPFVHHTTSEGGHIPYTADRFDVIFTICVMHHVPPTHWLGFVSEVWRVLKPGGLAVVFEHNPYNPVTRHIVRNCAIDKDAVLIRPGKLRQMFAETGFAEIRTRTLFSVPPIGRVLTAADAVLGWLPFGAQYSLRATKAA